MLELGAGQTTRLLNAWAISMGGTVVTFEHNLFWAEAIAAETKSERAKILHLPLVNSDVKGGKIKWYTEPTEKQLPVKDFNFLIVDGPVGTDRLSRFGVVEHIPGWLESEWVIVWDDLDRIADLKSFALLIDRLREKEIEHDHVLLDGDCTVGLVFTPGFSAAKFMW